MQNDIITKHYIVAMDGTDDFQCLQNKASCKTMGYIIDNACVSEVLLEIEIEYQKYFTHKEPCVQTISNSSYDCFVTVSGRNMMQKSQLEFADDRGCNIFQKFLSSETTNTDTISLLCHTDGKMKEQQYKKLKFHNIVIVGLAVNFLGQMELSAENVDFIDLQLSADASSKLSCFFHCKSCSFSESLDREYSLIQEETQIELLHCLCLSFNLQDSSVSHAAVSSFVKVLNPGHPGNHSFSVINIQNCSVTNNTHSLAFLFVESSCSHKTSAVFQLFIENTMFMQNRVTLSPIAVQNCDGKESFQFQKMFVSNCSFVQNHGDKAGAVSLSGVEASVKVTDSIFHKNFGGSAGSLSFSGSEKKFDLSVITCEFHGNTGGNAGVVFIQGIYSVLDIVVASTDFFKNTGAGTRSSGSLHISGHDSPLDIISTVFGNTGGSVCGKGLINSFLIISVTNSKFRENTGMDAGSLFVFGKYSVVLNVNNSQFDGNKGKGTLGESSAGSIFFKVGPHCLQNISISTGEFHHNVGQCAGCICVPEPSLTTVHLSVSSSVIHENTGEVAGAVNIKGAHHTYVIFENNTFWANRINISLGTEGSAGTLLIGGCSYSLVLILTDSEFGENPSGNLPSAGSLYIFGHQSSLDVALIRNKFSDNIGTKAGSIVIEAEKFSSLTIHVMESTFSNNTGSVGGAISISGGCPSVRATAVIEISLSNFLGNIVTKGGSAVGILTDCSMNRTILMVNLSNTNFTQNLALAEGSDHTGGGFLYSAKTSPGRAIIYVKECKWENNTSSTYGGALALYLYESSMVHITQTQFFRNKASGVNSYGGACYVHIKREKELSVKGKIEISECVFEHNTAADGGSLFQTSQQTLDTELEIQNTTFLCCENVSADFIFVVTFSRFKNIKCLYLFQNDDFSMPGIFLEAGGPYLMDNVYLFCHNSDLIVSANSITISGDVTTHLPGNINHTALLSFCAYCSHCSSKPFAAGNGSLQITFKNEVSGSTNKLFQHYFHLKSPCQPCPFGGDCSDGHIKALPNYWGYKKGDLMFFLSCPPQYCCNNIDVPCDTFAVCAPHRTGQLCGVCETGFTESLMSTLCVANEMCNDWWVWPLALFLAVTYLMWYMFRGNVSTIFLNTLKRCKLCSKRLSQEIEENAATKSSVSGDSAYLDILIYFSNITSLLNVQVQFQNSNGQLVPSLNSIEKYFLKYLDFNVQDILHFELCPFSGIDLTMKTLSRPVFTLLVFLVWCVLFSVTASLTCKCSSLFKQFKCKLLEGFVEVAKYSYSGIAGATFLLLSCISIGDQTFWRYDAEIECYSTLQKIVILFAVLYTVPFVFISPIAGPLLRAGTLSPVQVMLACFFPFPLIMFWILHHLLLPRMHKKHVWSPSVAQRPTTSTSTRQSVTCISQEAQVLLDTFQGVYKEKYSYWESVIEIRKLIFCSFYLIQNNMYRLVFCTITSVFALVHHILIYPFVHIYSNRAEALSLSLLCVACVTNCIKSVYLQLGVVIETNTPTEQLLVFLNRLDSIFVIILISYIFVVQVYDGLEKTRNRSR